MSDKLGVSIIIPCYNSGAYVLETIASIQAQGMDPNSYEMILVNDGSDDLETLEALTSLEETENLTIIAQTNKGQSAARNAALKAAQFKYILPVDADDRLNADASFLEKYGSFLQRAIDTMEKDDDVALVTCALERFSDDMLVRPSVQRAFTEYYALTRGGYSCLLCLSAFRGYGYWRL